MCLFFEWTINIGVVLRISACEIAAKAEGIVIHIKVNLNINYI